MITTVLFDLDGTTVDTNELIIESYLHTLKVEGNQLGIDRRYIIDTVGLPVKEQLQEYTGLNEVDSYIKTYRKFNESNHDHYVRQFPNTLEVFKTLNRLNIKIGIVTSKIRKTAIMGLKATRLYPYVDVLITEDDVLHKKPNAEPINKALSKLNSYPAQTLMVGDSHFDILAAQSAKVISVSVGWSLKSKSFLQGFSPDYFVEDIWEIVEIIKEREKKL